MKSIYINLDSAIGRRSSIEESFARHNKAGWTLERFPAFDAAYVKAHKVQGTLRDEEKACFLSHRKVIEQNAEADHHIFILEDDACFAPATFQIIDGLLRPPTPFVEWDLLFTDVGITSIGAMADLVRLRRELAPKQQIKLLDLKTLPFFGTTAYIVNKNALGKIWRLTAAEQLNAPFDLCVRHFVRDGTLKAFVAFPFLTSASKHAFQSTQQPKSTERADLLWTLFKNMTWIEGDSFDPTAWLDEISKTVDDRSSAYGRLWAAMIDRGFPVK